MLFGSSSESLAQDSGHTGSFTVTGGGGGGSVADLLGLPKTPTTQAWLVYVGGIGIAGLILVGILYWLKRR